MLMYHQKWLRQSALNLKVLAPDQRLSHKCLPPVRGWAAHGGPRTQLWAASTEHPACEVHDSRHSSPTLQMRKQIQRLTCPKAHGPGSTNQGLNLAKPRLHPAFLSTTVGTQMPVREQEVLPPHHHNLIIQPRTWFKACAQKVPEEGQVSRWLTIVRRPMLLTFISLSLFISDTRLGSLHIGFLSRNSPGFVIQIWFYLLSAHLPGEHSLFSFTASQILYHCLLLLYHQHWLLTDPRSRASSSNPWEEEAGHLDWKKELIPRVRKYTRRLGQVCACQRSWDVCIYTRHWR